nr:MAG TPA: hypothetical protein [Bacteriophage sp.]
MAERRTILTLYTEFYYKDNCFSEIPYVIEGIL